MQGWILHIYVHGYHVPVCAQRLGNGKNPLSGDGVGVHFAAHHLSVGLHCLTVPRGVHVIAALIALPGVGGYDLSVDHCVKIHHAFSRNRNQLGKMVAEPGLHIVKAVSLCSNIIHVLTDQLNLFFERIDRALFLHGIALYQGIAKTLSILKELNPYQYDGKYEQSRHGDQKNHIHENAAAPAASERRYVFWDWHVHSAFPAPPGSSARRGGFLLSAGTVAIPPCPGRLPAGAQALRNDGRGPFSRISFHMIQDLAHFIVMGSGEFVKSQMPAQRLSACQKKDCCLYLSTPEREPPTGSSGRGKTSAFPDTCGGLPHRSAP